MTDFYQTDDLDYWENMGQTATETPPAEESAEAPSDIVAEAPAEPEVPPEEVTEAPERERDDKGRFVSKDKPEESPAELILGKFKSHDELAEAYQNLQRNEGRLASELGELRKLVEERVPEQAQPTYDTDELAEWFESNPTRIPQVASQAAQQYGSTHPLYTAAIAAWEDIDPSGAKAFDREVLKAELRAETAQPQTPAWGEAAETFAAKNPDFQAYAPKMRELAQEYEHIVVPALKSGSPDAQVQVLDFLLKEARGRETANLEATKTQVATEAAQAADAAIQEAQVASATAVQPEPPRKTAADLIGEEWEAVEKPHAEGWNI